MDTAVCAEIRGQGGLRTPGTVSTLSPALSQRQPGSQGERPRPTRAIVLQPRAKHDLSSLTAQHDGFSDATTL